MLPILISPIIYVLELESDMYYVGITLNLNQRIAQHLNGTGANWTRLYKPKRCIEIIYENCSLQMENEVTKRYIEQYGADRVRGGSKCKV
jgi:predicted GIY-YIG superfamily endonuclease